MNPNRCPLSITFLIVILSVLLIERAAAMASQFGTYSQAYLDRQKCKADLTCKSAAKVKEINDAEENLAKPRPGGNSDPEQALLHLLETLFTRVSQVHG